MNEMVAELVCTVFRMVIDEIGTRLTTQVFVMREDDTLVKSILNMPSNLGVNDSFLVGYIDDASVL